MPFPPCCLISPHLAGSKIPAQNRSRSCRNGFQTTARTTGVYGTNGFCAVNHVQKIIGLERKQLKTTGNRQKKFHRAVHTQEVTGSSPVVSTKKFLISQEIRFSFCFLKFVYWPVYGSGPSNTLTNMALGLILKAVDFWPSDFVGRRHKKREPLHRSAVCAVLKKDFKRSIRMKIRFLGFLLVFLKLTARGTGCNSCTQYRRWDWWCLWR